MCLGAQARAQNESARRQYKYETDLRERKWMQNISIYNAQKVKYNEDISAASLAQAAAYKRQQEEMNIAREEIALKYDKIIRNHISENTASNLVASGAIGKSIERRKVLGYGKIGREMSELGRKVILNDRELAMKTEADIGKLQGFKNQAFADIAFQPQPGVEPPQPVMRNVGAAAFMEALSIGTSVASAIGSFSGSDRRLKENIKKIRESISGLGIYTFNYIGKATKYIGTMADEVLKVKPEAVSIIDGFMAVNYGLIDINFEEVK